nr:hypothetical protein CFP56_23437 [Quercus suber]
MGVVSAVGGCLWVLEVILDLVLVGSFLIWYGEKVASPENITSYSQGLSSSTTVLADLNGSKFPRFDASSTVRMGNLAQEQGGCNYRRDDTTAFMGGGRDFKQAEEAISLAPLRRIRVDYSRKEDCGLLRNGFESHGEPSHVETDSDSRTSHEMRPVDMTKQSWPKSLVPSSGVCPTSSELEENVVSGLIMLSIEGTPWINMHFSAEKVDSSWENVGACMPYEVADLQGSVQSPDFVPQPLILPSERVLPSHRLVKLESNLVGRFYREGLTLGL